MDKETIPRVNTRMQILTGSMISPFAKYVNDLVKTEKSVAQQQEQQLGFIVSLYFIQQRQASLVKELARFVTLYILWQAYLGISQATCYLPLFFG